jgi:hypothetical protein
MELLKAMQKLMDDAHQTKMEANMERQIGSLISEMMV